MNKEQLEKMTIREIKELLQVAHTILMNKIAEQNKSTDERRTCISMLKM